MNKRYLILLLAIALCTVQAAAQNLKYVFLFIGDGMGMAQVDGTEMFLAEKEGIIGTHSLCFTQFPVATMVTTHSATNSVTDSAAGGTALACGTKTANHLIGMAADTTTVLTSIAERAKRSGCRVGIVTSVSIDHATPAAFYAHQPDRNMYYEIGCQLPASGFDFFAGAGFLDPYGKDAKEAGKPVFDLLGEHGYTLCLGLDEYADAGNDGGKIVLLSKDPQSKALVTAIDRRPGDLTLRQMTEAAVSTLARGDGKGFFLMVEGGKIDWSCHSNDAGAVFREVEDFDSAVQVAYDFYLQHPDETAIVVTADHETGGLALGDGLYVLGLKAYASQRLSVEELSARLTDLRNNSATTPEWETVRRFLTTNLGFWDTVALTADEEKALREEYHELFVARHDNEEETHYATNARFAAMAIRILDSKAHVSWASTEHSAGYVPLFAIGRETEAFSPKMDNTQIAPTLARLAGYAE